MAKFKSGNLHLKDDQKVILGDGDDSSLYWDGSQARIDTTLSGVTPTQDYHLSRKDYVDGKTWTESDITDLGSYLENVVDDTDPDLGGDLNLNQFYIELDPTPTADQTGNGMMMPVTVDANATGIGAALYVASDGNYEEADADAAATMPCSAIALEAGTGSKKVLVNGVMRDDSWDWTPGGLIYVGTTAGAFVQTVVSGSGDQVQTVGYALSADVMFFDPDYTLVEVA